MGTENKDTKLPLSRKTGSQTWKILGKLESNEGTGRGNQQDRSSTRTGIYKGR